MSVLQMSEEFAEEFVESLLKNGFQYKSLSADDEWQNVCSEEIKSITYFPHDLIVYYKSEEKIHSDFRVLAVEWSRNPDQWNRIYAESYSHTYADKLKTLIQNLNELRALSDPEQSRRKATELLLDYIGNKEVSEIVHDFNWNLK